jgi:deoxyadenosine/deoxycytidine kinase
MRAELKERFEKEPIIIGVLGVVGAGKSTLSDLLSNKLGVISVQENFGQSPFLANFYADPSRWGFHSQVWFLSEKIAQLKGLDQTKSYFVDPDLEMDRLYAKTLSKIGFMSKPEYRTYNDLFKTLVDISEIRKPDIYLLIDAKLPVIRQRIIKRARPFELHMLKNYPHYISELRRSIKDFAHSQKSTKVLYVNATHDNFIDDIHLNGLVERIKRNI